MTTSKRNDRIELLQGTLDLLVLRTLLLGPVHGHAIAKAIERNSEDVLLVEQGSLYPALHRLIKRGWVSAEAGISENNRKAKFYPIDSQGAQATGCRDDKMGKAGTRHCEDFAADGMRRSHEKTQPLGQS